MASAQARSLYQAKCGAGHRRRNTQPSSRSCCPWRLPHLPATPRARTSCWLRAAGGAAEVNLRNGDIANMGFAEAANLPVILVGDIERGGVIAGIVGSWVLLDDADRGRLKGYIVNKFRGDPALFDPAIDGDWPAHRHALQWRCPMVR